MQSQKPNGVPMLLGETMGGAAPPPRQPGTLSLDPFPGKHNSELQTASRCCLTGYPRTRYRTLQSQKPNSVPMLLGAENESHRKQLLHTPWKRNDCLHTGTAAKCRLTDALHPGKQKNGRRRKRMLSLSPFFMFSLCPWKTRSVFPAVRPSPRFVR